MLMTDEDKVNGAFMLNLMFVWNKK